MKRRGAISDASSVFGVTAETMALFPRIGAQQAHPQSLWLVARRGRLSFYSCARTHPPDADLEAAASAQGGGRDAIAQALSTNGASNVIRCVSSCSNEMQEQESHA
jgi:hypothetical protein